MLAVLLAGLATAHAFTPTLFFNLTLDPLDGVIDYGASPVSATDYASANRSAARWATTFAGAPPALGEVRRDASQRTGTLTPGEAGYVNARVWLPYRAATFYGSTTGAAALEWEGGTRAAGPGPFAATAGNGSFADHDIMALRLEANSQAAESLTLDRIELELGIQSTA